MDGSKCEGTNCPFKQTCYRYTAQDNKPYQAYTTFWKTAKHNEEGEFECDAYDRDEVVI